jgi:hypothetical protein
MNAAFLRPRAYRAHLTAAFPRNKKITLESNAFQGDIGESRWESNPPEQAAAHTGFEDRRAHQTPFYSHTAQAAFASAALRYQL